MGFKYNYNIENAIKEVHAAAHDASNFRNDGYICWGAKMDLYRLKWILESALRKCPTFADEDKWVKEQEKKQLIKILSEK